MTGEIPCVWNSPPVKVAALESQPTLAADRFRVRYFTSRPDRGLAAGPHLVFFNGAFPAQPEIEEHTSELQSR